MLIKFWLHITQGRAAAPLQGRARRRPTSSCKITDEDWRNREKWDDYELAVNDMVERTSTRHAPWVLVSANDKKHARVQTLEAFCKRLERAL